MLLETTRLVETLSHKYEEMMQTGGGSVKQQLSFLIEEVKINNQYITCNCVVMYWLHCEDLPGFNALFV